MPKRAEETVDVTSLITGIIHGYPTSAIPREYIQNSDDAKATVQTFIVDETSYPTTSLVDPVLQDSQGSALIAMNDQVFSEANWAAIRSIHSSSKLTDESQTGKNGLGFRASYHLTENPQILSGRRLMILDPHREFKDFPGGMEIDIIDEGSKYQDQLAPFIPIIKDASKYYQGTIFRLPLRTNAQASRSRIKNEATSVSEIERLFKGFVQNELEEAILFLKNISTIEIRHITSSGKEYLMGRVTIDQRADSMLFTRQVKYEAPAGNLSRTWRFSTYQGDKSTAAQVMSKRLGYNIGDELQNDKLVANVELAIPLDGLHIQGRLFTLLPLPIKTGFPLHVNAVFALTPDRQSLKNAEEAGLPESRERRLVEWNRAVFEDFAPTAWVKLLSGLTASSDFWSAWPPEEHDKNSYWINLIPSIINFAIKSKLSIYPLASSDGTLSHTDLNDDSVLLAPPDPKVSLDLLASLKLMVVQPPGHIFGIFNSGTVVVSASILSPTAVHKVLRLKYSNDKNFSVSQNDVAEAVKYLVFSTTIPTINNIFDLPWFVHGDGSPATLGQPSSRPAHIVPTTEDEFSILLSSPSDMLSWIKTPPGLLRYLAQQASLSASNRATNVILLTPDHVINHLQEKLRGFKSFEVEVAAKPTFINWIVRFWKWVMVWKERNALFNRSKEFHDLHLLPTGNQTIRKMSSKIVVFENDDEIAAWTQLGIHPLHSELIAHGHLLMKHGFTVQLHSGSYIGFLINNFVEAKLVDLRVEARATIQRSLYQARLATRPTLSSSEKEKFALLPIFRVRQEYRKDSVLASVSGTRIPVKVDTDVPLPILSGRRQPIYVDVSKPETEKLIEMVESTSVHNEIDLLEMAVDNWNAQPPDLQDKFIQRIFDNFPKLTFLPQLKTLPFVTVDNSNRRVPPCDLINPLSSLTQLYTGEKGKFPAGKFADGNFLSMMRVYGFLKSQLDDTIVSERIEYLSNARDHMPMFEKAKAFIKMLDENWKDAYGPIVVKSLTKTWLPTKSKASETLVSPSKCRDNYEGSNQHPYLYDLVFEVLALPSLRSSGFRKSLGWSDNVSSDVILRQFSSALEIHPTPSQKARIIRLITHLGQLHAQSQLSDEFLHELRKLVEDIAWVPVNSWRDPEAICRTKFALLSETKLRSPFGQVYWRDISNDSIKFLRAMGCTSRPSLITLYEELGSLLSARPPSIGTSILVLEEITRDADYDRAKILVPTDDNSICCKLDSVYYPDIPRISSALTSLNKHPLHRRISKALAEQLRVPLLSAELLEQGMDEGDDEEQMGEDLRDRIESFLRENDILYAVNEFLANADDAKATKFSILLDNRRDVYGTRVISPALETLQNNAYIIFYNDAVLSKLDFSGLRKVGRGGKTDEIDTHGRHGLGALAFYYFTDTPFVISGEYVMILDPTGSYLPPLTRSGQKRTSLHRKLSDIVKQYPDQLKRFENLFGFSSSSSTYDGTMFCLPLKATIPRKSCDGSDCRDLIKGSYQKLARNAFFFTTHLEEISAEELSTSSHRTINLWSMSATRSEKHPLGDQFTRHEVGVNIRVRDKIPIVKMWIISTCHADIPPEHANTAANLKLPPKSKMTVQIALDSHKGEDSTSYLFSTLQLPKSNFLPFHLHARFAISSNRQSLIFSAHDPKTAFNEWIINDIVPSLYLTSLEYLKHHSSDEDTKRYDGRMWWLNPTHPPDDMTIFVREAIFEFLPSSKNRLFQSVNEEWISFKEAVFSCDEPPVVRDVLTRLHLPQLVISPSHTHVNKASSATLVDGKYVKNAFNDRISELRTILAQFKAYGVFDILDYIKDEAPLEGLPLLILADKSLDFLPRTSERPVYYSETHSHCVLFSSTPFLHKTCSKEIVDALTKDASVNLQIFDHISVPKLVEAELEGFTNDRERDEWLERFWKEYDGLPGPPLLSSLESPNLKLLRGVSSHISLNDCRPDTVVQHLILTSTLITILTKLGINVLKDHGHPKLIEYIQERFPSPLINVLKCLRKKNAVSFPGLKEDERRQLASWMRTYFSIEGSGRELPIEKSFLLQLPIWEAQLGGCQQICPASDLHILPKGFAMADILHYLGPNIAVASSGTFFRYSDLLDHFKPMSAFEILNVVQLLPTTLRDDDDCRSYRSFLKAMIALVDIHTIKDALKFPDCNGILRVITDLYDRNVRLFAEDLKYTEKSSFLHPDFRDLSPEKLRTLGFQHTITLSTFKHCAKIVEALGYDSRFLSDSRKRNDLMEMARVTFDIYKTALPPLIMTYANHWKDVDAIAFIRPRADRRQGASYNVDPSYCTELSQLVAPSEIIRPEFESVAWTQCALPPEDLSDQLLAVNKNIGIPKASVVVEHLKVLATKIASRHPGDRTLIYDLKATYAWLNKNAEDAREPLRSSVDIPLFLNVVDPLTVWLGNWQPASKLVLDLTKDLGAFKAVKTFLREYDQLLLSAGCHQLNPLVPINLPSTVKGVSVDLTKQFSEMRRTDQLTDMFFEPTIQNTDDPSLDIQDLAAHKVFLAATLPYFRDKFEVEKQGRLLQDLLELFSTELNTGGNDLDMDLTTRLKKLLGVTPPDKFKFKSQTFKFEGTRFAAKAVLDFIYTGDFEYPAASGHPETIVLLENFLGLLSIADEWDMPRLKSKITREILENSFIVQLPKEFPRILKAAEMYRAEELESKLKDFMERNSVLLGALVSEESPAGDEDVQGI